MFILLLYIRFMLPLKELIAQGESQTLEFKFELNSARRIAATISAFANAEGGTLLIGVKDNGVLAGIRIDEEIYVLEAAASMYCSPPIMLKTRRWEVDGKLILEAYINQAVEKPVKAETEPGIWKAWLRYGASNRLASPVHIELWKMQKPRVEPPSHFSEKEQRVLTAFQNKKWLSLNQATKLSKLPRNSVARTLANFLRWDIVVCETEDSGGFVFVLKEDSN